MPSATQLCLRSGELAELLGVSWRTLHRMDGEGSLPSPIRLRPGGRATWRRQEILAWLAAGCPGRDCWTWPTENS